MLKHEIAANLEIAFSEHGFAEPSVATLQKLSGVSLRTLYKHYPSKQSMVIAALDYRHTRYINFLLDSTPEPGLDAVLHIFNRLSVWMEKYAPNGCLSINALSAFPKDKTIHRTVQTHKNDVKQLLRQQSLDSPQSHTLFLFHEGVSNAWPLMGDDAIAAAKQSIVKLL